MEIEFFAMALHLPDKRLSHFPVNMSLVAPTYISFFGRKEKQNDQKDSCIYRDGIAPSVPRIDGQLRQRAKLHRQLSGVRDRDEVRPHWQHQMRRLNLVPGSDGRWRLRSAAQRDGQAEQL